LPDSEEEEELMLRGCIPQTIITQSTWLRDTRGWMSVERFSFSRERKSSSFLCAFGAEVLSSHKKTQRTLKFAEGACCTF